VRHPVTSCISTYGKSGGLPDDGHFQIRVNIEAWVRRELVYTGGGADDVMRMPYFDAYLRHWDQYHDYVATTGLSANRDIVVEAYGKDRVEDLVRSFYYRFGHRDRRPESFEVFADNWACHPDWMRRAEPVVRRVAEVWAMGGLPFPLDEVMRAW
jgi:hypothetical protein